MPRGDGLLLSEVLRVLRVNDSFCHGWHLAGFQAFVRCT